jgi:hypothetical protein
MLTEVSISHQKTVKVQSQCVRVTLLWESVCINHSFGSSGLNLAYEGLLLGMRKGGRKETPIKLYLTHWTSINIMTVNTFIICFVGRDMLTQRRSSSSVGGPANVHHTGGPWGDAKVTGGHKSLEVPQDEVAPTVDTCRLMVGRARK